VVESRILGPGSGLLDTPHPLPPPLKGEQPVRVMARLPRTGETEDAALRAGAQRGGASSLRGAMSRH
jgi:hypothetical protein